MWWGTLALPRQRGYILPLAFAFLFVLLVLLLSLARSGQFGSRVFLQEELTFQETLLSFDAQNRLGLKLSGQSGPEVGNADFQRDFSSSHQRAELRLRWNKESKHREVGHLWANYDALFTDKEELPPANYSNLEHTSQGMPVAPDHTLADFQMNGKASKTVVYSAGFPYGAYAPSGDIVLEKAYSWRNPSLEETYQKTDYQRYTGLPVDLWAQGRISVEHEYPAGSAYSDEGPVHLPRNSGAVGYTCRRGDESYTDRLTEQINNRFYAIGQDQIDKSHLFGRAILDGEGLFRLFTGQLDFREILSVGQACKIPFFPIPTVQEDIVVTLVILHHPWPVDFSGDSHSAELAEQLHKLTEELQKAKDELAKLQDEKAKLDPKSKSYDDDLEAIEQKIKGQQSKVDDLEKAVAKVKDEIAQDKQDMDGNIADSGVPTNAQEEKEQTTKGWAIVKIVSLIPEMISDIIAGKDPTRRIAVPTRVVNLGDQDPQWEWTSSQTEVGGTMTIPRGRTLLINRDLEISGDLWIQKGATCYLKGSNLTVKPPADWHDFDGKEQSATDFAAYPSGRIILEPGATLLVDGDLKAEGGSFELGSVSLVGPIGPTQAIERAILCRGNIEIAHGIHPGMGVDDLVLALAKDDKTLRGFVKDFYDPLMVEGFPFIAKMPYIGPWQSRKCWFAEYSTTLVVPNEFPVPIPATLPFPNCLRKVFKYVTFAFATELNFTTGENFYTQSPFWFFGRGMTPVFTKTDPQLVQSAFAHLKWEKIALDALEEEGEKFLKEILPDLVKDVLLEAVRDILEALLEDLIPFKPPSCGKSEESGHSKSDIKEKIEEKMKELMEETMKDLGKNLFKSCRDCLYTIRNSVLSQVGNDSKAATIVRELPGVLIYSGRRLTIGEKGAVCASGMFYAEESVTSEARYTVGCLLSANGTVEARTLYHFPYYSRASLYNPRKPKDYKLNALDDFFRSAFQVAVPNPEKNTAGDVGLPTYHVTAQGWGR